MGIFGPMLQPWGGVGYVQGVGTGHGMQRDMVGMREVRILLECCLVLLIIFYCRTNSPGSTKPIKITLGVKIETIFFIRIRSTRALTFMQEK